MAKQPKEFAYPVDSDEAEQHLIDQILWTLYLDGPVESRPAGRATGAFRDALEARGVNPPASRILNAIIDKLAVAASGGYVIRETNHTRTYLIALKDFINPEAFAFPSNPFADTDDGDEDEDKDEIVDLDVTTPELVAVGAPDEPPTAYRIALGIVALAHQLTTEIATIIPSPGLNGDAVGWVKQVVDENVELRDQVEKLTNENRALRDLNGYLKHEDATVVASA